MATPFAGNVPVFDILIADQHCRSLAIQVKTSSGHKWPTDARTWMNLDFDEKTGQQCFLGPSVLRDPDLIMVCVSLDMVGHSDRFFVLTMKDLQGPIIQGYTTWLSERGWRRPRNQESYDNRYSIDQLAPFEDNWDLIEKRLSNSVGHELLQSENACVSGQLSGQRL